MADRPTAVVTRARKIKVTLVAAIIARKRGVEECKSLHPEVNINASLLSKFFSMPLVGGTKHLSNTKIIGIMADDRIRQFRFGS